MKRFHCFLCFLLVLTCSFTVTGSASSIPTPTPSQDGWNVYRNINNACDYNFSNTNEHACELAEPISPCTLGGTHNEFHLGTNTLTFYIYQGNVSDCGYSFVQSHLFDENNSYRCSNCGKTPFGDKSA